MKPCQERIENDIERIAQFLEPGYKGFTRRAFTKPYKLGREYIKTIMQESGMSVSVDAAANIVGTLKGSDETLQPIIIGSHSDTVANAGKYDGVIGIVAGIELVRLLKQNNIQIRHTLQVIDFTLEEANDFGVAPVGSGAIAGRLSENDLMKVNDTGKSLAECIYECGGKPSEIKWLSKKAGDISAYLELHIEQGGILNEGRVSIGAVTGIVGIQRYKVEINGMANHAGTTPMHLRSDALVFASELILEIEKVCTHYGIVGTVGKVEISPNAPNIIPGKVVFEIDIRSLDINLIDKSIKAITTKLFSHKKSKGYWHVGISKLSECPPVICDRKILEVIEDSCKQMVGKIVSLPSGAGHDGSQISHIAPIGMIFVMSCDGVSHCPEEFSYIEDVAKGIEVLYRTVLELDRMKN